MLLLATAIGSIGILLRTPTSVLLERALGPGTLGDPQPKRAECVTPHQVTEACSQANILSSLVIHSRARSIIPIGRMPIPGDRTCMILKYLETIWNHWISLHDVVSEFFALCSPCSRTMPHFYTADSPTSHAKTLRKLKPQVCNSWRPTLGRPKHARLCS